MHVLHTTTFLPGLRYRWANAADQAASFAYHALTAEHPCGHLQWVHTSAQWYVTAPALTRDTVSALHLLMTIVPTMSTLQTILP
jgi:hypothetical protein